MIFLAGQLTSFYPPGAVIYSYYYSDDEVRDKTRYESRQSSWNGGCGVSDKFFLDTSNLLFTVCLATMCGGQCTVDAMNANRRQPIRTIIIIIQCHLRRHGHSRTQTHHAQSIFYSVALALFRFHCFRLFVSFHIYLHLHVHTTRSIALINNLYNKFSLFRFTIRYTAIHSTI